MLSGELRPVMFVFVLARMTSSASPTPRRALDAHRRRLAEVGGDAVVALERRLDDLLLDLAVERDRDLVAVVVLADVDERVLLGELGERRAERALLARAVRAKTTASSAGRGKRAVASRPAAARRSRRRPGPRPGRGSSPSRRPRATSRRGAPAGAKTRIDVGLRLLASADPDALARPQRAGEQADVGDALAGRPSARS